MSWYYDDLIQTLQKRGASSNDGNLAGPALQAADAIRELLVDIQALQAKVGELESALGTATRLVDMDVIRVRPSEREFLLDWLTNANAALAPIRSLKDGE